MVKLERAVRCVLMGNTYPNLAAVKALGAKFDNGSKCWMLPIEKHPMNNAKQKAKLLKMLTELEEKGVEIHMFYKDRSER